MTTPKPPTPRHLRSVGLWGTTLFLTGPMATIAGASALAGDKHGRIWWSASRTWARGILAAAGMTELIVKGDEVLYGGDPMIVMSNHESHLDPPSIILSSDRPIGFLTKQELKWIPVFGWALEATGHVFIDRKNKAQSHASIDRAAGRIADGRCVAVFPEGTRSVDGHLLPFKKGGFVLAAKAQVPIVPVGVAGTGTIFPAKNRYVRGRGAIAVVYGDPIPTTGFTLETKDVLMNEVRDRMVALRDEARLMVEERL
jgi:1-acyl-sn-glycerol-3-phosphate acyltransferase